ncbi:Agenet-like domain-containing protein [Cynara cardunculus var. scolymus]|uniref:Agenet-like domain-containing protein n=1 Tax=Cynara cardunculus var. scolymus TaxID=59895 RepID=A0A103XGM5_CYNCS|nr:Agenet-like domain-containing protein [Cynara cardunculus var. scolymus]
MRFKKGSKLEVMNKEVPASWHVAEIVSENEHAYNVRYDGCQGVEKVSRKFIRPCPPANGSKRLVSGDIVEVFDKNSWKIATVSKVLRGGRLLVRPHGFTHEMSVNKKNIRARQSCRDDQWIPVGKISGSYEDLKFGKAIEPNCSVKMDIQALLAGSKICQEEDDCLPVYIDARLQESYAVSKKLKRTSPFSSSLLEGPRKAKKFKAAEKGCSQRHVSGHSFNQVDAFAYPGDTLVTCQGTDILSSDGESFNTSRDEEGKCSPPEQEVAVSIHRLELHAYRSTLEALYASGPLSWEKEALLTNLRINLHISNDEHLTELRHLISSGAEPQLEACISCFQGSKQDSGSAAFLLEKAVGHIQHPFATDKTASLHLSSLAGDDMLIKGVFA